MKKSGRSRGRAGHRHGKGGGAHFDTQVQDLSHSLRVHVLGAQERLQLVHGGKVDESLLLHGALRTPVELL